MSALGVFFFNFFAPNLLQHIHFNHTAQRVDHCVQRSNSLADVVGGALDRRLHLHEPALHSVLVVSFLIHRCCCVRKSETVVFSGRSDGIQRLFG